MSHHGAMSRLAAALIGLLTGLTGVVVLDSPAAAHARLLGSTPKDDSTVTEAVTQIRLRFSEPVRQSLTTVRVTGPDGTAHSDGDPVAVDATVTQKVSALPTGVIKIGWRTVSADGHTIQGSFTFTNRGAPASPDPVASNPAAPAAEPTPTVTSPASSIDAQHAAASTDTTAGSGRVWVAVAVAVLVAAGGALWWRRRRASA